MTPLRAVAALTALGALLRFATLDGQSYWYDEAITADLVGMGLADMLDRIPETESTPPLYYLLAWVWAKLFGTGEAGLRSLSALLGTATIPAAYGAATTLVSRRVGVAVAALATTGPLLVWYSQEARSYALLTLLGALSLLAFGRALRRPDTRSLGLWAAISALALATHYFAAFLVAAEAAWLVAASRPRRPVLAATGAVTLAAAALLPLALEQESLERADFIRTTSLAFRVARVPKQFLLGFDSPLEVVLAVVAAAVAAAGVVLAVPLLRDRARAGLRAAAAIGAAALAAPLLLSLAGEDYFETRNLIAVWLPLAIVVSAGLTSRPAGRAGLAGVALLCVLGVVSAIGVAVEPSWQRQDWRGLARALGPPRGERVLVISPGNGATPLRRYLPGLERAPAVTVNARQVVLASAQLRSGESVHPEPPPRPRPPSVPGFNPAGARTTDTFSFVRLRAPGSVPLATGQLGSYSLDPGNVTVLVQR